jgi:hypothetical protein
MAAERAEVHTNVAQHSESTIEAIAGIAFGEESHDMDMTFIPQG